MFSKSFWAGVAAFSLMATANAHMVITSPVPYGADTLNNSPLENDGSDFPCKQRAGVYDIGTMNQMPVGVPQKLAFKGGASHGGGSCQVSVTLDKEPTKESEWKVIHTILGGCPNPVPGNADGSPDYQGNPTFDFSIPKGMPNGQYTLAWTWFNKIGNREMYMNCAPITVTGGADNNDVYNSLPDMFVINIPNEECATQEGEDFVMPSPGLYVETFKNTALGSKTSGANCAAVTIKGAGAGKPGSVAQPTGVVAGTSSYAGASSSAVAPTSAPTGQGSQPSYSAPYSIQTKAPAFTPPPSPPQGTSNTESVNNLVTLSSMRTITATGPPPPANTDPSPGPDAVPDGSGTPPQIGPQGTNSTTAGTASTSTGSCSAGSVACSTDGAIVCIGSDQWGMCNNGCAFPMGLAAGTSCSAGTIGAIAKRQHGHLARHLLHARKF